MEMALFTLSNRFSLLNTTIIDIEFFGFDRAESYAYTSRT